MHVASLGCGPSALAPLQSNNRLWGILDGYLSGGFPGSLEVLALGSNNFTCFVPSSFGALDRLSALDLSNNFLIVSPVCPNILLLSVPCVKLCLAFGL